MLLAARYRLDEPLGRGGMGEVWRATDEVLNRPVAVKLLLAEAVGSSAATRFRQEAQATARLNHANVVSVYDFGQAGDRLFLVMELIEGHSLAGHLAAAGRLAVDEVVRIGAQAATGLAAAHRLGVVHRDIKPANLLLTADGAVKVVDFGIARLADQAAAALTGTGLIIGTSAYLAPERALGRDAGPASDLYALGCVLYELLTGRPPFRADGPTALLYQHVQVPPTPPGEVRRDVPSALDDLLMRLLAKEPDDRPTADQVAHRLTDPGPSYTAAPPHRSFVGAPIPRSFADAPRRRHDVAPALPMAPSAAEPSGTRFLASLPPDHGGRRTSPIAEAGARRSPAVKAWLSLRRGEPAPVAAAGVAAVMVVAALAFALLRSGPDTVAPSAAAASPYADAPSVSGSAPSSPSESPSASASPSVSLPASPPPSPPSVVAVGPRRLSDDPRVLLAQLAQGLSWAVDQGRLDPRVAEKARHDIAEALARLGRDGGRHDHRDRDDREAADRIRGILGDLAGAERNGKFIAGPALTRLLTHLSQLAGADHRRPGDHDDHDDH
ncbi:serine/threonine-protein kinase [Sphaerisporangium rhizosphaerae]|uniref:non-specific serine/threonine protein kinase n=1 Tax=Sphaerisporangium rhizosphaerae TaxID=2269375 RepID=A0ABW2NXH6_9ACTN